MSIDAPFPWFGGKRRVAPQVWEALGDVDNYVEPFAGSLAVLLGRPSTHAGRVETVNDLDHFLANFWRAVRLCPDEVAAWAHWPVNEDDLLARHIWLVNEGREILEAGVHADPDFCDARIAGWWVWGLCAWIGGGWCSGTGPWGRDAETGRVGVQRQLPHLGTPGQGVQRQLPHLGSLRGVQRRRPHLGNPGQGVLRPGQSLRPWFEALAARLAPVRVCTGDWSRVVTKGAMAHGGTVGVFLDPPYSGEVRAKDIYAVDDYDVAAAVRDWAVAQGDDPRLRIVLAGYAPEHDDVVPPTWRRVRWSANASYQRSTSSKAEGNAANRHQEVLWCSPACLDPVPQLFEVGA